MEGRCEGWGRCGWLDRRCDEVCTRRALRRVLIGGLEARACRPSRSTLNAVQPVPLWTGMSPSRHGSSSRKERTYRHTRLTSHNRSLMRTPPDSKLSPPAHSPPDAQTPSRRPRRPCARQLSHPCLHPQRSSPAENGSHDASSQTCIVRQVSLGGRGAGGATGDDALL